MSYAHTSHNTQAACHPQTKKISIRFGKPTVLPSLKLEFFIFYFAKSMISGLKPQTLTTFRDCIKRKHQKELEKEGIIILSFFIFL